MAIIGVVNMVHEHVHGTTDGNLNIGTKRPVLDESLSLLLPIAVCNLNIVCELVI